MGRLFASFEEAWSDFAARETPLESFWDSLSDDDEATVDVWLLLPDERARDAARAAQRPFAHLDWIAPLPGHFLHVTLAAPGEQASASAWRGAPAFDFEVGPVTCFHEAIVAEVGGDGPRRLRELAGLPVDLFLPHLSLGYVREAADPGPLRDVLAPRRAHTLGRMPVREVVRCRVDVGRTAFFTPWQVVERVALTRR